MSPTATANPVGHHQQNWTNTAYRQSQQRKLFLMCKPQNKRAACKFPEVEVLPFWMELQVGVEDVAFGVFMGMFMLYV
jgi:hypothetical protein